MRAMRPSRPSSRAAMPMNISALSHSAVIAKRMPERPEQSASAVTALGTTARSGMPGRSRSRGGRLIAPASLRDPFDQLGDADPADDRLAGDGALAEQDLAGGAGGQIDVDAAAKADQADALPGEHPVAGLDP